MAEDQQALAMIVARNLISAIELASFLIDPDGTLVFFNEHAGDLIGYRFEEVGRLSPKEWNSRFGPFDEFGQLMPQDNLPLTAALREGLPANGRFRVRGRGDEFVEVEVSALPLVEVDGFKGAIVVFWRTPENDE